MDNQHNKMEFQINVYNNTDHITIYEESLEDKYDNEKGAAIRNRILKIISSRTASFETSLQRSAIAYSENRFQHNYVSPLNFAMFNMPPEDESLDVLWSYRRTLSRVAGVLSHNEIKQNEDVKKMQQIIGNLVGNNGPMSETNLTRIIIGTPPTWEPVAQNLTDLTRIAAGMNGPPTPIHSTTPEKLQLDIVVLTLLSNLSVLMKELNKVAISYINSNLLH